MSQDSKIAQNVFDFVFVFVFVIFFLQKSGIKTPILADTVLDHPTSKWAGTHNFKDIANFHRCFKNGGT